MEMGHEENRGVGKFSSIFTKHGSKSPKRPHAGHAVVSRSVFPEEPTKRAVTPIGQHIFRRLFASWQRRKMTKHPFDLRFLKTMSFFVSIFGKAKTWSVIESLPINYHSNSQYQSEVLMSLVVVHLICKSFHACLSSLFVGQFFSFCLVYNSIKCEFQYLPGTPLN